MDTNEPLAELMDWIYDHKEIFNSAEYLEFMNLLAKAVDMGTEQKQLIINNYHLYMFDSSSEEEIEDEDLENDENDGSYSTLRDEINFENLSTGEENGSLSTLREENIEEDNYIGDYI